MSRLALRSHYWGALVVVAAAGELNAEGAELLADYLRRVQQDNDVVVDLWDVSRCDLEGVEALERAQAGADAANRGFAVVADPNGPCVEALTASDGTALMRTYADRRAARTALRY